MRLKDQSVAHRSKRGGAYSRLSLRLILCTVLSAGCALTSSAKNVSGELSVDTIDARIAVLQKRVDSFTTVIKQLRDDSAKTATAAVSGSSPEAKQLADIDEELAKNKSAAADLKVSYDKARQDSIALAEKIHDQLSGLRKTGDSLDKVHAAVRAAAAPHAAHAAGRDSAADERALAKLQSDTARYDSLVQVRERALAAITVDVGKFRQDSIAAEKQRNDDRDRFRGQLHSLDSLIMIADTEVSQAVARRTTAKTEKERKIAQIQDTINQMDSLKQQNGVRIADLNKEVGLLGAERANLKKSVGDEQNQYARLRAPYDSALAKAEANVRNLSQDKPLLEALKTKLTLDTEITAARDLLDKAIQAQTDNKGSKKLVASREARLDTLLSERDTIVGATPGIKEREAAFSASSGGGDILSLVDSARKAVAVSLSAAESQRETARKNLAQFDQTNPPPKNPVPIRIALMDSMINSKKKESIQMTDWNDSLNIQIKELQKTLTGLTAATQAEDASADSLVRTKTDEKVTLIKNKTKLQHDNYGADSTDAASILSIKSRYDAQAKQKTAIQEDIDKAGAALAKAKRDLSALQERIKQATATAVTEKTRADSLAAARQKQVTEVADEQAKNAQAIASMEAQQAQQLKAAAEETAKYAAAIADNNKKTASLQVSGESIRKASLSGKQSVRDAVKRIEMELAAVNKLADNAANRITSLKDKRETLVAEAAQQKKDQDQALQEFNELWALLSNKQIDDANKRFKQDLAFLKKNLDEEHFKSIKVTIDRMMKVGE